MRLHAPLRGLRWCSLLYRYGFCTEFSVRQNVSGQPNDVSLLDGLFSFSVAKPFSGDDVYEWFIHWILLYLCLVTTTTAASHSTISTVPMVMLLTCPSSCVVAAYS